MSESVKIPFASTDYQARFEHPYVGFIGLDRPRAFEAVLTALLPFNIRLTDTDIVTTGTPADHKTIFRIPARGIGFHFGAEEYRFSKELSSWATAEEDSQILLAAEHALLEGSNAKVASCTVTVAMHLQPLIKQREEILAPFIPGPFKILTPQRPLQSHASHCVFADGDILLDFSLGFVNGIFLRFSSHFHGHPPLPEIFAKVRSDQATWFKMLDVEEIASA